ncbi:hypothetical protein HIM_02957 [Hirsutella minnesotensis 3608]|nr:hypothetical protein HIM_02957 [Hirsutella minnesotensis 3608]
MADAKMAERSLDPGLATPERPGLHRRRSKNPLRNMMQHLTVEPPNDDESGSPRRESLIRRLSWRKSRSPSAHSDASSSACPSATFPNADPALCAACASLAGEIDTTLADVDEFYTKAVNPAADDAFDGKESLVARLKGLDDSRWGTTCPLCNIFGALRVPGDGEGDYALSAFSTRDCNYLIDHIKVFDSRHPIGHKAPGLAPAFLGVVPKKKGPGARDWNVSPEWFRESGMLLRTVPPTQIAFQLDPFRGRSPAKGQQPAEPPALAVNDVSGSLKGIWGREIGPSVDLDIARDWLRFCQTHHAGRCQRRLVKAEMPGFQLLDCDTTPPRVVRGSIQQDYVALSYVLGKDVREAWPKVVQDAAAVTRDMGIRYLWVDRMCLQDATPENKAQHISRMDEIFEGATLTIIAAHGDSAGCGLPGVGSTHRPLQPKYRFTSSGLTVVSSLKDPRLSIEQSTWYTRGWTYQEGLLSRRRLIFTEEQMYWECDGMLCPETLVMPLDHYHDPQQERMCDFMRPGLFNSASCVDGSWQAWKKLPKADEEPSLMSVFRATDKHIVSYSKRHLTYDEDSLAAFMGMSRHLEKTLGRGRLGHLLGMPIWLSTAKDAQSRPGLTKDLFALSTSFWQHKTGAGEPVKRRRHLPSWTWAGWKGPVELVSSIVVADPEGTSKERRLLNHHYVSAKQLARDDQSPSLAWTYSPNMVVVRPDGGLVYDFFSQQPPELPQGRYLLRVSDPLVLDRVKARAHPGGWMFNDVSVDVRLSRGRGTDQSTPPAQGEPKSGLRDYVERHARGEQMTVLWFVEDATVMLLVLEQTPAGSWERVGRARMAFAQEPREVVRRFGRLEVMLNHLPLRRLGHDVLIE